MNVSILIPTFNRKGFSKLISHNLKCQTYPFIKEILVADDGLDTERLELDVPFTVLYYKVPRMMLGEKRNFLASKATGDYLAHMDTDDFYHRDFLSTSVFNLIKSGKKISGSSDMLMYDKATGKTYKQRCINMHMVNEATMVYTKGYAEANKFSNTMTSEGLSFVNIKHLEETPIENIMICVSHASNTVDKTPWINPQYETPLNLELYEPHIKIISKLSI